MLRLCTQEESRTPKLLRALAPEASASASSATWVLSAMYILFHEKYNKAGKT